MLKFLLSGKQAREFALKVAKKLVEDLGPQMSEQLRAKIDEKINAGIFFRKKLNFIFFLFFQKFEIISKVSLK